MEQSIVARSVQNSGSVTFSTIKTSRYIGVLWSVFMVGCIVPPPIEPELPEINRPPRIDSTSPNVLQTISENTPISISARPLDPNDEKQLYYAWIGKNSDRTLATVGRTSDNERVDGIFFVYETIELELDPCGRDLRGESNETIWLYLSDRPLSVRSDTDVRTEEGGFIESHSWTFDIRPGVCDGF